MIWKSVLLMTLIDIAMIGITAYGSVVFFRYQKVIGLLGIKKHIYLILSGLLAIGIFYSIDLLTMHVSPLFMAHSRAMAIMTDLHLNWYWLVALLSVSVIVSGLVMLGHKLLPIYSSLKSNELRFQDIAANVPGVVFQLQLMPDGSRCFPYVSPNITDLLGLDPIEVMNDAEAWFDIIHPEDLPALEKSIAYSVENSTPCLFEGRMIRQHNGELMWFRSHSESKKQDDGSILCNTIILDITERKQTENISLRMGRLMGQSVNEIYVFDAETLKFLQVSKGALDNLGYSMAEMRSLTPVDLKNEFTRENFEAMLQPLRRGDINQLLFETPHSRKDGSTYPAEVNLQYAGEESPPVFMAIIQDVTERKETQEALHQAHDQLEQRVLQRTHELAESEARQRAAKQEAEHVNDAKSEFLARMSHELRTPLNAIFGFSQLLQSNETEPLSPTQRHDVEEIIRASRQLLDMVNKVLDLARIESGHLDTNIQVINVRELIDGYVHQTEHGLTRAKQITIRNRITDTSLHLLADPGCFRQIMINLLSNAVKYNEDGGSVIVDCKPAKHDGWLRIQISDTGPGISKDRMPRLFEPFERFTDKNNHIEGTGIGLSVTKHLVETMGGIIGVDSTPSKGSTFWFELPLGEALKIQAENTSLSQPVSPDSPQIKILYIEDELISLQLMQELLGRHKNITILTALTGEKGLELAETELPDLILMDIGLPGIDGYQTMEILKNVEATRDIPVVAISADAMPADVEKGLAAGFKNYLTKPINLEQLNSTIDQVLAA